MDELEKNSFETEISIITEYRTIYKFTCIYNQDFFNVSSSSYYIYTTLPDVVLDQFQILWKSKDDPNFNEKFGSFLNNYLNDAYDYTRLIVICEQCFRKCYIKLCEHFHNYLSKLDDKALNELNGICLGMSEYKYIYMD